MTKSEDESQVTETDVFGVLKPRFAGSVWMVEHSDCADWTPESAEYVRAITEAVTVNGRLLVNRAVSGDERKVRLFRLPPTLCLQREETEGSEDAFFHFRSFTGYDPDLMQNQPVLYSGFYYDIQTRPQWAGDGLGLKGLRWEIVLITVAWPYVCVNANPVKMQGELVDAINLDLATTFPQYIIDVAPQDVLDEAFIGTETKQISLRGLHRRTNTRPDKKTLTGNDLRFAIDPYGDHTFAYDSGRGRLRIDGSGLSGVSAAQIQTLRESAFPNSTTRRPTTILYNQELRVISGGPSRGVVQHAQRIDLVRLLLLETAERLENRPSADEPIWGDREGLDYLSGRIPAEQLTEVNNPFEVQLQLRGEAIAGAEPDARVINALDAWQESGSLEPNGMEHKPDGSLTLPVDAHWADTKIARLEVLIRPAEDTVEMSAKVTSVEMTSGEASEALAQLDVLIDETPGAPLDIKFESGHTISAGRLFRPTLREHLFQDWEFFPSEMSGKPFDITKEKPKDWRFKETQDILQKVRTSDSLFSQISLHPERFLGVDPTSPDWVLLNNDQPEEIADFIFMDSTYRRIALIHTKGADSRSKARRIAIGPYEACVPQAIKNLRHIELGFLEERFQAMQQKHGRIGSYAVKSNGTKSHLVGQTDHAWQVFKDLRAKGLPQQMDVICHVPHVSDEVWERETGDTPSRASRMLSMLLLDAKARAVSLNASFSVWSEKVLRSSTRASQD